MRATKIRWGLWIAAFLGMALLVGTRWALLYVQPARAEYCIRAMGGTYRYEDPGWGGEERLCGDKYTYIDFEGVPLTDTDVLRLIPELNQLPCIQMLNLKGTQVGDAGLKGLLSVRFLNCIDVTNSRVTHAGIAAAISANCRVIDNTGPHAIAGRSEDLVFSSSGRLLAIAGKQITVCDVNTDATICSFPCSAHFLCFSHDEKRLAAALENSVFVWDLATQNVVLELPGCRAERVGLNRDGSSLFVQQNAETREYLLASGEHIQTLPGVLIGRGFVAEQTELLKFAWYRGAGASRMVHPDIGEITGEPGSLSGTASFAGVSYDGNKAVFFHNYPGQLEVVSLATGQVEQSLAVTYKLHVESIGLNRDATRLATGDYLGTVQVFDSATGSILFKHTDSALFAHRVALSPDGTWVAASFGGSVKWWKIPDPAETGSAPE